MTGPARLVAKEWVHSGRTCFDGSGSAAPFSDSINLQASIQGLQNGAWTSQFLPLLADALPPPLGTIVGIGVVLAGIHLPPVVASCFELMGSCTSGVAVFAVGLVLAAHPIRLSPVVLAGSLARITVQSAVLFALLHLLHVVSPLARESLVCCSFPFATVVVLFASR
jgi:predicted permease